MEASQFMDDIDADVDEQPMSGSQVLQRMTQAYINEASAPKLLPHKFTYVDCLIELLEKIQKDLAINEQKKKEGRLDECISELECSIHRLELHRINYIINSYVRCRLEKIEENPAQVIEEHVRKDKATKSNPAVETIEIIDFPREVNFASAFLKESNSLLNESFLNKLPTAIQKIPIAHVSSKETTRVFTEVLKEDLGEVAVHDINEPGQEYVVSLEKGGRYLFPYHSIEEHLEKENVRLL